jgi:hypothetical protein
MRSLFIALTIGFAASAAFADPASIPHDFSNKNVRFTRPQAYLAATLADESDGSARMAAGPSKAPQFAASGFDVVKARQASAASGGSPNLSGGSARLARPQYVAATTLADDAGSARLSRPQFVAATTLTDESGQSARLMRPQYAAPTSLTDDSDVSARMSVEPSKAPEAPVSGFAIIRGLQSSEPGHASHADLSAANLGNRAGALDVRSK